MARKVYRIHRTFIIHCNHNIREHLMLISSKQLSKIMENSVKALRNIEIKAKIGSDEEFAKRVSIAKELTQTDGELIQQHDVFYKATNGRLKMRFLNNSKSVLVQYNRPDISGPKLSEYNLFETDEPHKLHNILEASIGILGEVKKDRWLFLYEQTRIHLDKVENLGNFLEFEVCLRPEQSIDDGTNIANKMMELFEIKQENLMTGAYLDELLK